MSQMIVTSQDYQNGYDNGLQEGERRGWEAGREAAAELMKKALDVHRWAFEQCKDERDNAAGDALGIAIAAIRKLKKP